MRFKVLKKTKYRTRRLLPGDEMEFDQKRDSRHWRTALVARGFIEPIREPVALAAPPRRLLAQLDHDGNGKPGGSSSPAPNPELAAARLEYETKLGKRPFPGWSVDILRARIAAADEAKT